MTARTIRVIAVGDARVPRVEHGRLMAGRMLGRDARDAPAVETVNDTPYVRSALLHGDLRRVDEDAPATAPEESPQ